MINIKRFLTFILLNVFPFLCFQAQTLSYEKYDDDHVIVKYANYIDTTHIGVDDKYYSDGIYFFTLKISQRLFHSFKDPKIIYNFYAYKFINLGHLYVKRRCYININKCIRKIDDVDNLSIELDRNGISIRNLVTNSSVQISYRKLFIMRRIKVIRCPKGNSKATSTITLQ